MARVRFEKAAVAIRPVLLLLLLCAGAESARADVFSTDDLKIYGDFRLRLESDFDSQRADGTPRDDRTRVRVRARLGLDYQVSKGVSFGLRVRSGAEQAQQSPLVTVLDLDGGDTGDTAFTLDRWYVEGRTGRVSGWVGRNDFPFWTQNELFWDQDVTVAGLASRWKQPIGESGQLTLNAAYLSLPAGMRAFAGRMAAGQAVYSGSCGDLRYTTAAGLFVQDGADVDDPDAPILLDDNGLRDYRLWLVSGQLAFDVGGRTLTAGIDLSRNDESYSPTDPDSFTAANHDETDSRVISVSYGGVSERGDWQVAVFDARVETLGVIASYAQDDWVRWGSATQTAGSDLRGQELRFAYAVARSTRLMARLYLVDAITSVQDGKRFRVDCDIRF